MKRIRLVAVMLTLVYTWPVYAGEGPEDSGLLWLVNNEHRLSASFVPLKTEGRALRPEALCALTRMQEDMRAAGIDGMWVQSAYRSFAHQRTIYNNKKNQLIAAGYDKAAATAIAAQTVAYPGASEHQIGLAVDLTVTGELNQSFADTPAGRWIYAHSHEYGFIVRYPQGKTAVTGIVFEPWHLRYVGAPHASFMKERGFCFEEYIDYVKEAAQYVFWTDSGGYYLVAYRQKAERDDVKHAVDISALGPDAAAGYIITMRKPYPKGLNADEKTDNSLF